ncbi:substrate-binding domain-containing protein [Desulfovibrio inopinatus]|uniref:substrate-binding domain-containing protein n=1 Tax=Desulfovibrio inopinatus TaxID=102109 RepID=UPI0003F8B28C|nr:substrate-binding domain-containing protein [Desulfovibrio inopinatus]
MRKICLALLTCTLLFAASAYAKECKKTYGDGEVFSIATGSPGELGLLEVLADAFNAKHGSAMCWKKAGSGASLMLLKEKDVDAIMVHAPAAEKKAVSDGWARNRQLIGSNEFYIVGPKDDPAGIKGAKSVAEAYKKISDAKALFLSRGDNSGTHKKEMAIWKKAGVDPSGDWYVTTKDFMMATLLRADKDKAYFMTDSSTWVAGKKDIENLDVLFKGDMFIVNTYHGLCQPEGATKGTDLGCAFIEFVGSDEGQSIIREYGKKMYGESMYNDKEYAKQYDH